MKITRNGHLYQLAFMPRFFPVNCYLVEEESELTLIDAALPFSVKGILQAAEQIGKPITRIVLTHAHGDHIGALDGLKKALPQAQVYISQRDAKLLAGNVELEAGEPQTPIKGGIPKGIQTKPDVLLADGDRIGSLQAFAAPGHTPGFDGFPRCAEPGVDRGRCFSSTRRGSGIWCGEILVPVPGDGDLE